jgi:hypothetical protein
VSGADRQSLIPACIGESNAYALAGNCRTHNHSKRPVFQSGNGLSRYKGKGRMHGAAPCTHPVLLILWSLGQRSGSQNHRQEHSKRHVHRFRSCHSFLLISQKNNLFKAIQGLPQPHALSICFTSCSSFSPPIRDPYRACSPGLRTPSRLPDRPLTATAATVAPPAPSFHRKACPATRCGLRCPGLR